MTTYVNAQAWMIITPDSQAALTEWIEAHSVKLNSCWSAEATNTEAVFTVYDDPPQFVDGQLVRHEVRFPLLRPMPDLTVSLSPEPPPRGRAITEAQLADNIR